MQYVGRFGTLVGFACQICAAGAAVIWPNQAWIGWSLFTFGGLTLGGTFLWWVRLNRDHIRDSIKRVEPVHIIGFGLVIAIAGVLWLLYRGPASISQEDVAKITAPFQTQIDSLKQQLAQQPKSAASASVSSINPKVDVAFGPYQPEEVRLMILALGQMYDVVEKKIRPALIKIQDVSHFKSEDQWKTPEKVTSVRIEFENTLRALHAIVSQDNPRFAQELRPTIEDEKSISTLLQQNLEAVAQDIEMLGIDPPEKLMGIIRRDSNKLYASSLQYVGWIDQSKHSITEKMRKLRDYKP